MRRVLLSFLADVLLVVVFAASGRASHEEAVFAGLWHTAWPFVAALVVGWIVAGLATGAWRRPLAPVRVGIPIWLTTVAGGMVLRALDGQGTAVPFIIVATIVLGLFLVGWRAIATLVGRRAAARQGATGR